MDLTHTLEQNEFARAAAKVPQWADLDRRTLFMTGATGFMGRWMLGTLLSAARTHDLHLRVVVLTRDPARFVAKVPHLASHGAVRLLKGDVRSFIPPRGAYSHVLHLATESGRTLRQDPDGTTYKTAVQGTRRVLDFATSHDCRRFLFASSGAVYGRRPTGAPPCREGDLDLDRPDRETSGYAAGKREAERMCLLSALQSNTDVTVARCFTFVGPYMDFVSGYAVADFIRDAVAGRPVRISGDGGAVRSYLFAGDMAAWLWNIVLAGKGRTAYNVGSPEPISVADLAVRVTHVVGASSTPVERQLLTDPRAARRVYVPDTSKAARDLGLKVWTALDDALSVTADWYRRSLSNRTQDDD